MINGDTDRERAGQIKIGYREHCFGYKYRRGYQIKYLEYTVTGSPNLGIHNFAGDTVIRYQILHKGYR